MMKSPYSKYLIFFTLWVIYIYYIFSIYEAKFDISLWKEETRIYLDLWGLILGLLLSVFWYIDDNLKINK